MSRNIRTRIHRALWTSKRRKVFTMVSTVCLVATTAAMAYFILSATGSGTSSPVPLGTAGSQALDIHVAGVPAGLKPGDSTSVDSPVDASASNPGTSPVRVSSVDAVVLCNNNPCPAGYFTLGGNTQQIPKNIAAGQNENIYTSTLTFNNLPQDQSDVAGQNITVQVTAH